MNLKNFCLAVGSTAATTRAVQATFVLAGDIRAITKAALERLHVAANFRECKKAGRGAFASVAGIVRIKPHN